MGLISVPVSPIITLLHDREVAAAKVAKEEAKAAATAATAAEKPDQHGTIRPV
jgi:hypothetical protein